MSDENQRSIKSKVKGLARLFLLRIKFNKHADTVASLGKLSIGKTWPLPQIGDISKGQKIIVLSPHPDDDVLGCGGTLTRYYDKGSHIKTIILTDGCMGKGTADDCDLVNLRKKEAIAGSSLVGCNDLMFLDNIDTKLRVNRKNKDTILELLRNFNPDIVFVPSIFENHPDHIESAIILAYAFREYEGHPLCYCYEIWGLLFPNTLIDITAQVENKTKAINAHWSQVTHQNIRDSILGLNSYRAIGLGKDIKSCEAFYKCSKEEFIKMVLQHF